MRRTDLKVVIWLYVFAIARVTFCCPVSDTCSCEYRYRSVSCVRTLGLQSKLPKGIPTHTDSLKITLTTLTKIGPNAFKNINSLTRLDLSSNKIETVSESAYRHLRGLRFLNLENNRLKLVPDNAFRESSELKVLHLSGNKILVIVPFNFENLGALEELYLLRNPTMCIALDAFAGLSNLLRLEMSDMNTTLDSNLLASLTELRILVIRSFHRVKSIPDELFRKNTKLEKLHIEDIQLTNGISSELFTNLKKLNTLSLRECSLSCVPVGALKPVESSLVELDLSHNHLRKIAVEDFKGMVKLRILNLRKTELVSIPAYALALPSLISIDLSANTLKTLANTTFGDGPLTLRNVTLGNNPWICDCRLEWLVEQNFHHSKEIPVSCAEPSGMQSFDIRYRRENRSIKKGEFFQCEKPEIYKFGTDDAGDGNTFAVDEDEVLSFDAACDVRGYPRPRVAWFIKRDASTTGRKRRNVKGDEQDSFSSNLWRGREKRNTENDMGICEVCEVPSRHNSDEIWVTEDGTLHVRNLMGDIAYGEYICMARNDLGMRKRSLFVREKSIPLPSPQSVVGTHWQENYFVTEDGMAKEIELYYYNARPPLNSDSQYASWKTEDYNPGPRLMASSRLKNSRSPVPLLSPVSTKSLMNDDSESYINSGSCQQIECGTEDLYGTNSMRNSQPDRSAGHSPMAAPSDIISSLTRETSCCGALGILKVNLFPIVFPLIVNTFLACTGL